MRLSARRERVNVLHDGGDLCRRRCGVGDRIVLSETCRR
jgi:hypothetical protein